MTLTQSELEADNLRNSGQTQLAIHAYQTLFSERNAAGDFKRAGGYLQMIGVCHKIDNATELSLKALNEAADYYEAHGLLAGVGNTYRDIASTYEYVDQIDEAKTWMNKALIILKDAHDPGAYGITLAKLGHLKARLEDPEGETDLKQAIKILAGTDAWFYQATAIERLASLYLNQDRFPEALAALKESEALFDRHPDQTMTRRYAQIYGGMAYCFAKMEELESSKKYFKQSMDIILGDEFTPKAAAKVLRDIKANETLAILSQI